jgi:gamma-glutamyltranspeptidase/glutathione hydrolase
MTEKDAIGGTIETWQIRKPAVESRHGLVASQHFEASQVGARVLAEGGNAVDAAVAAGIAIGTVEPWMSGLGGGGHIDRKSTRLNSSH